MLFEDYTRFIATSEYPMAMDTSTNEIEEGSLVMGTLENGAQSAKLTDGSTDAILLGASMHQKKTFTHTNTVEYGTVSEQKTDGAGNVIAPPKIELANKPEGGTSNILVKAQDGTVFTVKTTPPAAKGEVQLDKDELIFHKDDENRMIEKIVYRFSPTVRQVQHRVGDGVPGLGHPADAVKKVGVILNGWIYTDQFDPSEDFSQNKTLKAGANGMVTMNGSGAEIPGHIVHVPTPQVPFLGLYINL
jgi:hypothetical protein